MIRRLVSCVLLLLSLFIFAMPTVASAHSGHHGKAVKIAKKKYLGRDYKSGGMDCSRLTMLVYNKYMGRNHTRLQDNPVTQYSSGGRKVRKPGIGDLVFWDERGRGISHVGLYAGNGNVLHASSYFDEVVVSDMQYIDGYVGAVEVGR
jgi:cell wall-associated NlpC family hydrolase